MNQRGITTTHCRICRRDADKRRYNANNILNVALYYGLTVHTAMNLTMLILTKHIKTVKRWP